LRAALELEVKKQTAHLTRAIEVLQAEIDARKQMEAEVKAHVELLEAARRSAAEPDRDTETLVRVRF